MTHCTSGKSALTAEDAQALGSVRRRKRKAKKVYRCPLCRMWHLAKATKTTRSIVGATIRRWKQRRADRFLDMEDEE